ncbi:hypothetical protein LEMLEM_LOCUS12377 [Lemmus lemmus]
MIQNLSSWAGSAVSQGYGSPGTLCLLSERKYSKRQAIKQIGNSCPGAILEHGHCLEYLLRTSCEAMTFFYEDMHF